MVEKRKNDEALSDFQLPSLPLRDTASALVHATLFAIVALACLMLCGVCGLLYGGFLIIPVFLASVS